MLLNKESIQIGNGEVMKIHRLDHAKLDKLLEGTQTMEEINELGIFDNIQNKIIFCITNKLFTK